MSLNAPHRRSLKAYSYNDTIPPFLHKLNPVPALLPQGDRFICVSQISDHRITILRIASTILCSTYVAEVVAFATLSSFFPFTCLLKYALES